MAERVGFEPTLRLPVNRISSAARSTTLPPLRKKCRATVAAPVDLEARRLAEGLRLAKSPDRPNRGLIGDCLMVALVSQGRKHILAA